MTSNDDAWGDLFAVMIDGKQTVMSNSQETNVNSESNTKKRRREQQELEVQEQYAITEFLRSRGEDCRQLVLDCTRELGISDNTKDINPKWMPGWKFGKTTEMKIKNSSPLSKTLELMEEENTTTMIQQSGSVKIQTLLKLFAYQRDIRALSVWIMFDGLERKGTMKVESQIAALCTKKSQKCGDLITLISNDNDLLEEKGDSLVDAAQHWKRCLQSHEKKEKYSLLSFFESRMKVIIAADELYYRLYYEQLLQLMKRPSKISRLVSISKTGESKLVGIPHPHVYFSIPGLAWLAKKSPLNSPLEKVDEQCFYDPLALLHHQRTEESLLHFHETGWSSTKDAIGGHWDAVHAHYKTHLLHAKKRNKYTTEQWLQFHETPAHPLLVSWRNSIRDFPTHLYGYATLPPNSYKRILQTVRSVSKSEPTFVEMGAGTGYLAHCLQASGATVRPFDVCPLPTLEAQINPKKNGKKSKANFNEYHGHTPSFCDVMQGTPEILTSILPSIKQAVLVLCFPPPGDLMGQKSVRALLESQSDGIIVHIGEWQGLTGSQGLEDMFREKFHCLDQWSCLHWGTDGAASVTIWKLSSTKSEPILTHCSNCVVQPATRRCTFARSLAYCGPQCFDEGSKERQNIFSNVYFLKTSVELPANPLEFTNPIHFQALDLLPSFE